MVCNLAKILSVHYLYFCLPQGATLMWCVFPTLLKVLVVEVLTVLILSAVDKVWNQCGDATLLNADLSILLTKQ